MSCSGHLRLVDRGEYQRQQHAGARKSDSEAKQPRGAPVDLPLRRVHFAVIGFHQVRYNGDERFMIAEKLGGREGFRLVLSQDAARLLRKLG